MTTSHNIEQIKVKIRALLAKAAGTDHEGEAGIYIAKASELMEKYQLDLFELDVEDPIGCTEGLTAQSGPPSYKSDVQCALARYYGCRPVINNLTGSKWIVKLYGPESSRLTTELMTEFVWQQINAAAKDYAATYGGNRGMAVRSISKALCVRIRKLVHERAGTPPATGGAFSIVTVDAVQAYIDREYGPRGLVTTKNRPVHINRAAMEVAGKISLNIQATGRNQLRLQ